MNIIIASYCASNDIGKVDSNLILVRVMAGLLLKILSKEGNEVVRLRGYVPSPLFSSLFHTCLVRFGHSLAPLSRALKILKMFIYLSKWVFDHLYGNFDFLKCNI